MRYSCSSGISLKQFLVMVVWVLSGRGSVPVPDSMSKCCCLQGGVTTTSTRFSCTSTNVHLGGGGGNSITASGHRNLSPPPHEPLDVNPPPHLPRDDGALKQEGITDKIRAITLSISIDFFFYGLLFLYKHIFNRFTHEKRVQDCEQSERAPHRLENTACLGAKNGNV